MCLDLPAQIIIDQLAYKYMHSNYDSLSPQQLRDLYKTTGVLLLLDVPEGIQFGIDNILWKIGQKFKGIKFIPFGCHIISYSLKDENNMFKLSKFLYFDKSKGLQYQMLIYKWCPKYSMFTQIKGSQAQGYRQGVLHYHFDSYLGAYPLENYQFWKDNTNHLNRKVLQKLDPIQKIYKFQEQYNKLSDKVEKEVLQVDVDQQEDETERIQQEGEDEQQGKNQTAQMQQTGNNKDGVNKANQEQSRQSKTAATSTKMNNKFQPLSDTVYYTQIPRILTNQPHHISRINIDKTQVLIEVILKEYIKGSRTQKKDHWEAGVKDHWEAGVKDHWEAGVKDHWEAGVLGVLGQIQYSFVYFLIGEDQDSFNQWKKLVNLLVYSEEIYISKQMLKLRRDELARGNQSILKLTQYFEQIALQFIVVLYNQLKQFPVDFFIDQLSKSSFMQSCLKRLKQYQSQIQGTISKKVKKRLQKLLKLLQTKFNYELKQNQEEYQDQDAPIIVEQNNNYF